MGILDKLLPGRARKAKRLEEERGLELREREQRIKVGDMMIRHLTAASESRRRPGWDTFSLSADAEVLHLLPILRSRARLMADNDAKAGGLIHKEITNTIGPRFTVQAKVPGHVKRKYGLTDQACAEMVVRAEEYFRDRVANPSSRDFDWKRMRIFHSYIRLMFRHFKTDGGLFVRYMFKTGRSIPFSARIVEPECIGTPPQFSGDPRVVGGLRFSADYELEGFYVALAHPGGIGSVANGYEFVPVRNAFGLPQMVFHFDPHRETSTREIPWLHKVLVLLNDVADYKDSELQRKKLEACIGVFVKLNDPDAVKSMLEVDSDFSDGSSSSTGRSSVDWPKNQIHYLEKNESIETVDPNRPGNQYVPFLDSHDRDIGNGIGRSFERVSNNYGAANFSATRVSGIEDYVEHETEFRLFAPSVFTPIWDWSMWALSLEEGNPLYRFVECEWQRYIKPSWDPESDADAASERLANGTSDRYEEAAMRGRDVEDVIRASVRAEVFERDERARAGLPDKTETAPTLDSAVDEKIGTALQAKEKKAASEKQPEEKGGDNA